MDRGAARRAAVRVCRRRRPLGRGEVAAARLEGGGAEGGSEHPAVGVFWIELRDFAAHFNTLYVARLLGGAGWEREAVAGEWRGEGAAGCPGRGGSWRCGPAVLLRLSVSASLFCVLGQSRSHRRGETTPSVGFALVPAP